MVPLTVSFPRPALNWPVPGEAVPR